MNKEYKKKCKNIERELIECITDCGFKKKSKKISVVVNEYLGLIIVVYDRKMICEYYSICQSVNEILEEMEYCDGK